MFLSPQRLRLPLHLPAPPPPASASRLHHSSCLHRLHASRRGERPHRSSRAQTSAVAAAAAEKEFEPFERTFRSAAAAAARVRSKNRDLYLKNREVHFWYVVPDEVKDASLLKQYMEILSPSERESILQMDKDKVQRGAVLARTLVRTTLSRYTNYTASPSALKFRKNQFGKPELEWKSDDHSVLPSLHFNVSHSSSLIACGVTMDVPIGIDVEEKRRNMRNSVISFARRFFSPAEFEFLHTFSDPERQRKEFIKLWTLKEAYVKALGRGFSAAPFRDFTIRFEASKTEQVSGNFEIAPRICVQVSDTSESLTSNWRFSLLEVDNSHYAAVCVERDKNITGRAFDPLRLKVWKTVPLVEDECILERSRDLISVDCPDL